MRSDSMPFPWKVGVLAKRTGLTVRTLHHYDEMGLLKPSDRSESGHRLYTARNLARLQQILSLRQLGFALEEIGGFLNRPQVSVRRVIELQLNHLRTKLSLTRRLYDRLEGILGVLDRGRTVSAETLIKTIEVMNMLESHYTAEQLEQLKTRRETVGEERIREVEGEWRDLFEKVQLAMDRGEDPASEPVKRLARKWLALVQEFTGGDPGITQSLGNLYREKPDTPNQFGMKVDPAVFGYIGKTIEAVKTENQPSES